MESRCPRRPSSLVRAAASELESLRMASPTKHDDYERHVHFPAACRALVLSLPGNQNCVDCGSPNPEWASVSFGCMLCLRCSGKHRGYGVMNSFVRSIRMDSWSHSQVLSMLEGGNEQLQSFFERHRMGNGSPASSRRYLTKAAQFYRTHLSKHVDAVSESGAYQGREKSRPGSGSGSNRNHQATDANVNASRPMRNSTAAEANAHRRQQQSVAVQ